MRTCSIPDTNGVPDFFRAAFGPQMVKMGKNGQICLAYKMVTR